MSWKNTDPLELWKSSTTLPINKNRIKNKENDEFDEKRFIKLKVSCLNFLFKSYRQSSSSEPVRIRFWMSTSSIDSKQRVEYFWKLIKAWPDDWERRAIVWSKVGIPITNTLTALYIGKSRFFYFSNIVRT
jgi:hypothetical protein